MKILVVKTNNSIRPAYDSDIEAFKKMPSGEIFEIDYVKPRNIKLHRLFFALMKLAFENQEAYPSLERMRKDIIKHAGYSEIFVNFITGEEVEEAKSISFNSMDDVEFSQLYESCKAVIIKWLGIDNASIEDNITQYY